MAEKLAKKFGFPLNPAYVAGLLHDCARSLSAEALLLNAKKYKIKITPILRKNPILLHGEISAKFAYKYFGIKEKIILKAIACHIVGTTRMSKLAKLIFIADFIEPSRNFPAAQKIRNLLFKNKTHNKTRLLELAVKLKAQNSLDYAFKKNWQIHPVLVKLAKRKV
jgi:predicted HD superfamily hydrolase involved in NAD metabolism